jgi:hypothetical protein
MGYNFKLEPELYLKVKWITENVGGMKSTQVFLDKACEPAGRSDAGDARRELTSPTGARMHGQTHAIEPGSIEPPEQH